MSRAWGCLCSETDTDGCWDEELCCRQIIQEFGGDLDCGVHCSEYESCCGCNEAAHATLKDGREASICEILKGQLEDMGVVQESSHPFRKLEDIGE